MASNQERLRSIDDQISRWMLLRTCRTLLPSFFRNCQFVPSITQALCYSAAPSSEGHEFVSSEQGRKISNGQGRGGLLLPDEPEARRLRAQSTSHSRVLRRSFIRISLPWEVKFKTPSSATPSKPQSNCSTSLPTQPAHHPNIPCHTPMQSSAP